MYLERENVISDGLFLIVNIAFTLIAYCLLYKLFLTDLVIARVFKDVCPYATAVFETCKKDKI